MGAYRLHADYDRNGRLTAQDAEWAVRNVAPGALVRANLDADTRQLPTAVSPNGQIRPDRELQVKTAGDNEPLSLEVHQVSTAAGQLFVVLPIAEAVRTAVIDATGHRILPVAASGGRVRYALPPGPFPRKLSLESVDLPASPAANRFLNPRASPAPVPPLGERIPIRLERDGPTGTVLEDEALVTLAPLLLIGNAGRLERLYMCEVTEPDPARPLDDNGPSVADVRAVLAELGVPLVLIPGEVNGGDTWIQDQYQLGYTETPDGLLRVLLHAPRTRSDAAQTKGQNLAGVTKTHFLSRDLGVCQSFWDRELTVTDPQGRTSRITFAESDLVLTALTRVRTLRRQMFETIGRIGTPGDMAAARKTLGDPRADVWKSHVELPLLLHYLTVTAKAAAKRPDSPWHNQSARLDQLVSDAEKQVRAIKRDMPLTAPPAVLMVRVPAAGPRPARDLVMTRDEVLRLQERLQVWHSSHNYGGNIEVGPPAPKAPAGWVVVGNVSSPQPDGSTVTDMDPDLLAFLKGQSHGRQKVLEVDTSWLDVGHVDEMLAFVPDLRDPHNGLGTVLRASPRAALAIIDEAKREFRAGLSGKDRDLYLEPWEFRPLRSRLTVQGSHPVTHLLRGLQWLHRHDPGQVLPTEPPEIYLFMATKFSAVVGPTANQLPLPDSPWQMKPPILPANLSIFELFHFSDEVNEDLESSEVVEPRPGPNGEVIPGKGQLTEAEEKLTEAYGRIPIRRIPVFFDSRSRATGQTAAFTPDLANLQVVGDRLLIPRPHGPRMSAESAARVLGAVAQKMPEEADPSRFTPQWLRARGLDRTYYWARRGSVVGGSPGPDVAMLANAFADGFPPQMPTPRIHQAIINANPGAFDAQGFLRGNTWRKLIIPEKKVDLFEAWTEAVADRIGYRVRWVETWYYHVRLGSIHCGTNVLRSAPTGARWWR